jgi:hypothetical protein
MFVATNLDNMRVEQIIDKVKKGDFKPEDEV